jgi:hypothetical protein
MKISGFQEKETKVKKLDIESFKGKEDARKELQSIDICGEYTGACDGVRGVITGNVENFFNQTFDPSENYLLNLLSKVLINPRTLDYEYNKITINLDELLQAATLFAKNMHYTKIIESKHHKTGKVKQIKSKVKRPLILRFDDNKLALNFPETEMNATLDSYNEMNSNLEKVAINPQYLLDALKLLKNRKYRGSLTIYMIQNSPIVMYAENIYIMILPIRIKDED